MQTAIIIVTYNGLRWIKRCLESCGDYPVVVVDNASTDGTVGFIEQQFPNVILLKQDTNLGFGQANNLGISYALNHGAKQVFLLNQDAYLEKGSLKALIATQKQHSEFGVISPIHLTGDGKMYDRQFYNVINEHHEWLPKNLPDITPKAKPISISFVNAAGWLVSKSCLVKVGGFDPLFFHYGEDNNYCQRVLYHGFKVGVITTSFIKHDREHRPKPVYKEGSHTYWTWYMRRLKKRYADVNNTYGSINKLFIKRLKSFVASVIKLDCKRSTLLLKELCVIVKHRKVILVSKTRNTIPDTHYLTVKTTNDY
ncbi:glycosyltransferase family 2 protein [Mangrovimonas spongiae]|uniref:Glycosyltransferase family 2 protein n=1 Tax=Mangrovimonas spongiae TaxID=2494697 RepID=A0A428K260_9FLAO|nr:glycosyltransferase family 2 protein [Mangrovimonas spongiae]RSK40509.1 glycosyltransferase family 2 protein [Mangrovimonas spongiae]